MAAPQKQKGFNTFLQYHSMVEPGIMLLKNGSYLMGFLYQGPDIESSTVWEAEHLSSSYNNAVKRLDEGWMIHQTVVRALSSEYPDGRFDEPTNLLIDLERRAQFTREGTHYETFSFIFLTYFPPEHESGRKKALWDFVLGRTYDDGMSDTDRDIKYINETLMYFETSFSQLMRFRRLSFSPENDELLHALNMILNTRNHPCRLPDPPDNLDSWLAREAENGEYFLYDGQHAVVLTIDGLPGLSYPGILSSVENLPMELVWSSRFIVCDHHYARDKIKADRKKWRQKVYPFMATMLGNKNAPPDKYALQMVDELDDAASLIEDGKVIYGHYTTALIVRHEDPDEAEKNAREVIKLFERLGFAIRIEKRNALEAFLGSIPGHGRENVRKPFIHSLNLADLAPLTHLWAGAEHCPCPPPNYPASSPPLLQAASVGTTPFRLNLHVDDVGHTIILGPTGAGKSTLLALIASQFERYEDAQIFAFDKGYSLYALTSACYDAIHYDLGTLASRGGLCPLAEIDSEDDRGWAFEFIEILLQLQLEDNKSDTLGADDRNLVREAVGILANATKTSEQRTITSYLATVQSKKARELLQYYQIGNGAGGSFIDGKSNDIEYRSFVTFEIQDLMTCGKNIVIPVLMYLFRQIEKRLTGRPSLLIIDEAWLALSTPVFAEKIREWLKVFRKANCAVILATQNVADVADSSLTSAIVESCPTKIFLPNPDARGENSAELYRKTFGLNDTQINLIAGAVRKRQYYLVSPAGRRLFELGLGPATLSFVGAGAKDDIKRIKELQIEYCDVWPYYWLKERSQRQWAEAWLKGHEMRYMGGAA
jgi:type IV secretion system protein VirB4